MLSLLCWLACHIANNAEGYFCWQLRGEVISCNLSFLQAEGLDILADGTLVVVHLHSRPASIWKAQEQLFQTRWSRWYIIRGNGKKKQQRTGNGCYKFMDLKMDESLNSRYCSPFELDTNAPEKWKKECCNISLQRYLKRTLCCILESHSCAPVQNKHFCVGTNTKDNRRVVHWVALPTQIVSCRLSTHESNYKCSLKQLSQHDLPLPYREHDLCIILDTIVAWKRVWQK